MQSVLNVRMTESVWDQAVLPVSRGGLGIRAATHVALPAFLSSVTSAESLTVQLLPPRLHPSAGTSDPLFEQAVTEWQLRSNAVLPNLPHRAIQKSWDSPLLDVLSARVLSAAQTQAGFARLTAAAAPFAGAFLEAIPCSAVGTRMDNSSFRIAVALRLGAEICSPHNCICGAPVDSSGVRHSPVNGITKRALASADVPARLEPSSLSRDDGKRPDGMSLMPWKEGRCLIWDFTCADTLAQSHLDRAVLRAATVADDAEQRKRQKYVSLSATYYFVPICIETLGPMGEEAAAFFADVGQRIATATGEPRSKTFLMQRLSIAVQQGNAACVLGTVPVSTDLYI